jgi:acetyltransferase-like isoleucine patch superfamily enzyme
MIRFQFTKPFKSYTLHNNSINFVKIVLPSWYSKIDLGDHSFINDATEINSFRSPQTITIGKYCSIGKCSFIVDGDHNIKYASTFPFQELGYSDIAPENKNIKLAPIIKNDVWIADNTFVYGGVIINDGAVIAGNSVVTKDVPPYAVVAGNPAKIVKYRFSKSIRKKLEETKWWDLPHDYIITELAPCIDNIELFIEKSNIYKDKNG